MTAMLAGTGDVELPPAGGTGPTNRFAGETMPPRRVLNRHQSGVHHQRWPLAWFNCVGATATMIQLVGQVQKVIRLAPRSSRNGRCQDQPYRNVARTPPGSTPGRAPARSDAHWLPAMTSNDSAVGGGRV